MQARAVENVVRAELWDLQPRYGVVKTRRAEKVENTRSGKMRLKGRKRRGKWREMGRYEWKVGVGTTALFVLRVCFMFLAASCDALG